VQVFIHGPDMIEWRNTARSRGEFGHFNHSVSLTESTRSSHLSSVIVRSIRRDPLMAPSDPHSIVMFFHEICEWQRCDKYSWSYSRTKK